MAIASSFIGGGIGIILLISFIPLLLTFALATGTHAQVRLSNNSGGEVASDGAHVGSYRTDGGGNLSVYLFPNVQAPAFVAVPFFDPATGGWVYITNVPGYLLYITLGPIIDGHQFYLYRMVGPAGTVSTGFLRVN